MLIYDYEIRNNELIYTYWMQNGSRKDSIKIDMGKYSQTETEIKDEQIYYQHNGITSSPDRKLKPILIDDKYIIYLSDKNRGVGMYTFRKIELN